MTGYSTRAVTRMVRQWIVPTVAHGGASPAEVAKAWEAAGRVYRALHDIDSNQQVPDGVLRVHAGDGEIIVEFTTEKPYICELPHRTIEEEGACDSRRSSTERPEPRRGDHVITGSVRTATITGFDEDNGTRLSGNEWVCASRLEPVRPGLWLLTEEKEMCGKNPTPGFAGVPCTLNEDHDGGCVGP